MLFSECLLTPWKVPWFIWYVLKEPKQRCFCWNVFSTERTCSLPKVLFYAALTPIEHWSSCWLSGSTWTEGGLGACAGSGTRSTWRSAPPHPRLHTTGCLEHGCLSDTGLAESRSLFLPVVGGPEVIGVLCPPLFGMLLSFPRDSSSVPWGLTSGTDAHWNRQLWEILCWNCFKAWLVSERYSSSVSLDQAHGGKDHTSHMRVVCSACT